MANEGLWSQFIELDGRQSARRGGCQWDEDSGCLGIVFLNKHYTVDTAKQKIFLEDGSGASFGDELCILAYLINAKDIPLANKLTPGQKLVGGQFFFRGHHSLPTEKLTIAFGDDAKRLLNAAETLNASACDFGDASLQVQVLPRLPLTVMIWGGDEEFEARSSILFDETAASQMPLDALLMAVELTVKLLIAVANQ
ncbi:MAG: DUF3786 domain-containing protein [Planctomycetota bacterium]|jgi:hypothetical protein